MASVQILVVDDEPGITRLCERLLRRADYTVNSFTDPIEALDFLQHNKVDLLLVDIRMPDINGFDVITRAQQQQPDAAILVMTGFGTVETAIQALRKGVDGLLLKPFESGDELIRSVRQALEDSQKKRDIARSQALRPLFDITETFLAETHPERLMDLILNAVCGHLRCTYAAFYQYFADDHHLKLLASRGKALLVETNDPEVGLISRVDQKTVPLWVNVAGPGEVALQKELINCGLESAMCAPIIRLNIRGVLYAGRGAKETPFREVEWEMFLLLARQAAVAVENANLYAELRDYVQRVEESQQALIRTEKMATAGRLTASIAHEINNPLQAVQNCLHLAMHEEIAIEKRREYLDLAKSELDRLMSTVQRMLEFYRPGGVDPQRVDLVELLKHVLDLMMPQFKGRGIRVSTSFSSRLVPILAVSSQLQQVFINLILNAYDAMPKGGELRVTARPVRDMVEIHFQDTGPGIPPEARSSIFEPFASTKEGGTGFGLSVSYGIIAAHGGSLDLIPERDSGACFRVTIPVRGEK